jgi:salicylate hydroxylase
VLMGDAAHPTMPYLGQGAALAVEDALVLGTLLGNLSEVCRDHASMVYNIPIILEAFEYVQKPRTTMIVQASSRNGFYNHLEPGTIDQLKRDHDFANFDPETTVSGSPWIDADFNRRMLGRDSMGVALYEFHQLMKNGRLHSAPPKERDMSHIGYHEMISPRL